MTSIRIFVSSPGDVAMERVCTERIIDRLQLEFAGRATLEGFFWEHEPMRATASFSDPENIPLTADFDIVVCILWARLGTMLSKKFLRENGEPYPSGTAFEIETAVASYRERNTPDILVYRRTQAVPMPANDPVEANRRADQLSALNQFIQTWFYDEDSAFRAAINEYSALGQFESKLERPLRRLIQQHIDSAPGAPFPPGGTLPVTYHGENPYRGLAAYTAEDASVFFGRSQAIEDVLTAMRTQAEAERPFTLVHGASGSGKSSLLRAGVIPMVTHLSCPVEGVACWRTATMVPGASGEDLLHTLASSLGAPDALPGLRRLGLTAEVLAEKWATNPSATIAPVLDALRMAAHEVQTHETLPEPPVAKLLLLVDQLEQAFSDDRRFPPHQRDAFAEVIGLLARSGVVWVVATIRNDQIATFSAAMPELAELAQGGHVPLLPPTEADMDLMIRLPARAAGVHFEENPATGERLETRLLREARASPDGLPLLSFVLQELYTNREQIDGVGLMTHAEFDRLGGLEGAVRQRAEEVYQAFLKDYPSAKGLLAPLARALVTLGPDPDSPPLRRSAALAPLAEKDKDLARLLESLSDARLLTITGDADQGGVVYVTHEALLRKWEALAEAIEADRRFLTTRMRAATGATEWHARSRPPALLWDRGVRLEDARALAKESDDLDPLERDFIACSILKAGNRRRVRGLVAAAAVATVAAAIIWNQNRTSEETRAAEALAARAAELEDLREQLALARVALDEKAWEMDPVPELNRGWGSGSGYGHGDPWEDRFEYPDLAVAELSRRILALDPQDETAFTALVASAVHVSQPSTADDGHEERVLNLFAEWRKRGLPKNELLNLEAHRQWNSGNKEAAIASWASYLRAPSLDDTVRRNMLTRMSGFYLAAERWSELERLINSSWSWEDNALARVRRAKARMMMLKLGPAEEDFLAASAAAPEHPEVLALAPPLQRMLSRREDLEAANEAIGQRGADKEPGPWIERARVLLLIGRNAEALADIERAGKIMNGKSTLVEFMRAIAKTRAGEPLPDSNRIDPLNFFRYQPNGFEEAIDSHWARLTDILKLDVALVFFPKNADSWVSRSAAWHYFLQHDIALQDAEKAIQLAPGNYDAHYWRASNLLDLDRFDDALEAAKKLKQVRPTWIDYLQVEAEAMFGKGETEIAVLTISRAISLSPSAYFHELRAKFLRRLGREADAELDDQAARKLRNQN